MLKVAKDDSEMFNSVSCGDFNLMGYTLCPEKTLFTKITPNPKSLKKLKNNKSTNDLLNEKNILLEFDLNKHESKNSTTTTTTTRIASSKHISSTNSNSQQQQQQQQQFISKSLNDMKQISVSSNNGGGKQMPPQPPGLQRMLTIEEFYRQTPEQNQAPGRSSRLSHAFEEPSQNLNEFKLHDTDSSDDENEDRNVKSNEKFLMSPQTVTQQMPQLPLINHEKAKPKAGILKISTTNVPNSLKVEINELEKPLTSKSSKHVNVARKISTNKLFKVAEINAQTLDLEINQRFNSAKDKSILANQQSTHSDSVRLSYLKRYVANGLAGKNNSKFYNGFWNRLPMKTKALNMYEIINTNDNTTSYTRTSTDMASNPSSKQTRPNITSAQQQQLQPQPSQQQQAPSYNSVLPPLQKEVSIIDLHLPPTIKTQQQQQQAKMPPAYYKRNLFVYLNNKAAAAAAANSTIAPASSTNGDTISVINSSSYSTRQHLPHPPTSGLYNQKSVTFNNTISVENYAIEHSQQQLFTAAHEQQDSSDYLGLQQAPSQQNSNNNTSYLEANRLQMKLPSTTNATNSLMQAQMRARYRANLEINGKRNHLFNVNDDNRNYVNVNTPSLSSFTSGVQARHIKFV